VVAERPFFEECDLSEGAACVLLVRAVQDLTDGVLLLIMLRCYSYFNNVEIYMNNYLYKFY
jgi:hypothetical protein